MNLHQTHTPTCYATKRSDSRRIFGSTGSTWFHVSWNTMDAVTVGGSRSGSTGSTCSRLVEQRTNNYGPRSASNSWFVPRGTTEPRAYLCVADTHCHAEKHGSMKWFHIGTHPWNTRNIFAWHMHVLAHARTH